MEIMHPTSYGSFRNRHRPEEPIIIWWIARDKDGTLGLYDEPQIKGEDIWVGNCFKILTGAVSEYYQEIRWTGEAKKVKVNFESIHEGYF